MSISSFLKSHRGTKEKYTHVSLNPPGKYFFKNEELPKLYELIQKTPVSLLESRHNKKSGPLLIDLDFEYIEEPKFHKRQYNEENITKFVECIHNAISYFYGPQEDIEYVVSEKPTPTIETGKRVKDGIHLLCRNLSLSYKDQHKIRLYALEKHFLQNSFDVINVKNSMDKVYDIAVVDKNCWYLLYCGKPGREPYSPTISYIVDDDNELMKRNVESRFYTIQDLSIVTDIDPIEVLDDRKTEFESISEIKIKKGKSSKKEIETSIISAEEEKITHVFPDTESITKSVTDLSDITGGRPAFIQSFDTLMKLVLMWSPKRADNYAGWRNCVFCIATCAKECNNIEGGLKLAHSFVLNARGKENYNLEKVDQVFKSENRGTLGFIIAHQWARYDNFLKYISAGFSVWWKVPWAHFTVAREFYGYFPDSFLLVNGTWYVYNGIYWSMDSDSAKGDSKTIKKWLSTKLFDILYEQIKTQRDVLEGTEYQKKLNLLNMLYNKSFKNDVLSELGQFYSNSKIKFDQRPELLAFTNKIYNLDLCEWVDPSPEMYISITTGYDYVESSLDEIENMEKWVSDLFDTPEKTRYILKLLASCLYRNNREEKAHFWLGRGRNGKGTLKEMMNSCLGHYAGKLDLSYFTTPDKHCGSANPHLYNLKDSRVVWCDEAESDGSKTTGSFSTGKLKSISGRDKLKARPLYSGDEADFEAGHIIALVNEMPKFTSFDFALLARLVCIKFPFVFLPVGEYNPADPSHKLQDPRIKEKVIEKRMAFMNMLLKWYKIYNTEALGIPLCIKGETTAITDELDAVGAWAKLNLVFKTGERTPVHTVYAKYHGDSLADEKDYVSAIEFGKRIKRYYDIKNCRQNNDEFGQCMRILGYKLK
jgi:phage/plasmid-associated DNA primase